MRMSSKLLLIATECLYEYFSHDEEEQIQCQQDQQGEVHVRSDSCTDPEHLCRMFGIPQEEEENGEQNSNRADEPACLAPVLLAGPEFGGNGEDQVGSKDERPPRPAGAQNLQVAVGIKGKVP